MSAAATSLPVDVPISMCDLGRLDLILPSRRHGLRIELDRHLAAADVTVLPRLEVDALPAIADFVTRTPWFSILPSMAVHRGLTDGSLKGYRIVAPRITRQLVAVHNPAQPLGAAATKLVEILAEEMRAGAAHLHDRIISGPD